MVYYCFKLSMMFWLSLSLGLCGLSTLMAIGHVKQISQNQPSLLTWQSWKNCFFPILKSTWWQSWTYTIVLWFLVWLIWFTSQFMGIIFLIGIFIQASFFLIVLLTLIGHGLLTTYVESSPINYLKLAFMQVFIATKANAMILFYLVMCLMIGQYFPAIIFFFGPGLAFVLLQPILEKQWRHLDFIY